MKKLLLLLLLIAGGVSTASADTKKIYFADNWGKTGLRFYAWNSENNNGWPGVAFPSAEATKVDGYNVYKLDLGSYDNFMIIYEDGNNDDDKSEWCATISKRIRKSTSYSTSSYSDGDYLDFSDYNSGFPTLTSALTVYTHTFAVTTASSWGEFRITLWNPSNSSAIKGFEYPGEVVTGTDDVYSYTHKSFLSTLGVLFADNSGATTLKTGDMTASSGTNKYYISTITKDGGQGIKTNASGYSTAVSSGNLDMTSGIAYVAENKGTWAQAHTIIGIKYGNPFLVAGEASTTYHFAYGTGDDLPCTNAFVKGSDAGVDGGSGPYNYILKGDAFYRANGNTVASTKAYLQLSEEVPAGARAIVFEEGNVTSISAVNISKNDVYYNLQGVKVAQPTKGLYIVNGKKVSVK